MYSDLFDHLGSGGGSGSHGHGHGSSSGSHNNSNEKQLVAFKAGKMELTLQENGNYWVTPDTRRGEIRIVWKTLEHALYWEWYDRREKSVAESDRHLLYTAAGNQTDLGTMERVVNVPNAAPQDRLYVWTRPPQPGLTSPEYRMYWMQDASDERDDELIAKVNQYLVDPASANPTTTTSTSTSTSHDHRSAAGAAGGSSRTRNLLRNNVPVASTDRHPVDALSNILENLGMPQNEVSATSNAASTDATSTAPASSSRAGGAGAAASGGAGTLTLADLQGAMAGLQQQQALAAASAPGPPLQEIVSPAAITSLLENQAVCNRLLEFLPEEQRSREYLEENLRSPQVQQTLRSLTAALLPDDHGSMDGYHSVLANFNMAEGAQEALENNSNNPIQAFLECVLKSVEKEGHDDDDDHDDAGNMDESKE